MCEYTVESRCSNTIVRKTRIRASNARRESHLTLPSLIARNSVVVPSSSGLGHRPLTAETPVRNRLGLPAILGSYRSQGPSSGNELYPFCTPFGESRMRNLSGFCLYWLVVSLIGLRYLLITVLRHRSGLNVVPSLYPSDFFRLADLFFLGSFFLLGVKILVSPWS
jgi:hypothetical protein